MRLIESVLLVVGAAALGAVACGLGVAYLAAVTLFRTPAGAEPGTSWGAAFAFVGCGLGGAVAGALAGFAGAVRWLSRGGGGPWTTATWAGVALGLAAAVAVRALGFTAGHLVHDLTRGWPGAAVFLAAAGTLGGLIGGAAGGWWARRAGQPPRRGRKRDRGSDRPGGG